MILNLREVRRARKERRRQEHHAEADDDLQEHNTTTTADPPQGEDLEMTAILATGVLQALQHQDKDDFLGCDRYWRRGWIV